MWFLFLIEIKVINQNKEKRQTKWNKLVAPDDWIDDAWMTIKYHASISTLKYFWSFLVISVVLLPFFLCFFLLKESEWKQKKGGKASNRTERCACAGMMGTKFNHEAASSSLQCARTSIFYIHQAGQEDSKEAEQEEKLFNWLLLLLKLLGTTFCSWVSAPGVHVWKNSLFPFTDNNSVTIKSNKRTGHRTAKRPKRKERKKNDQTVLI